MDDIYQKMDRLMDIQQQMKELLKEAEKLVRGTSEEERARRYWVAHIRCAIDNDHSYLSGSMITMQDTIDGLEQSMMPEEQEG